MYEISCLWKSWYRSYFQWFFYR